MTFSDAAIAIFTSVAASGALSAVLIWLSREWISTRLKSSIQHEYDQKLESIKAQLKAQGELALVELRTGIERHTALVALAHSSFAEGQKAAIERKLSGADLLWERLLHFRQHLPPLLGFVDILIVDEYAGIATHPRFDELSRDWTLDRIMGLQDARTETVRPYVGEYAWAIFSSYQAIMLRFTFLLTKGRTSPKSLQWNQDVAVRQLIGAVCSPEELGEFDRTRMGLISWLRQRLELKMLAAIRRIISGEEFSAEAVEQARLIQQMVVKVPPMG